MADKDNGGPAFPIRADYDERSGAVQYPADGMTLRDYFAAGAVRGDCTNIGSAEDRAKWAYEIADAMLSERAK